MMEHVTDESSSLRKAALPGIESPRVESSGILPKDSSRYAALIREAQVSDLARVLALEERLRENRPEAAAQGFLLSGGDTPEIYKNYVRPGCFFVVEEGEGAEKVIIASLFVLHPESDRMAGLKKSAAKFQLIEAAKDVFDTPNLSWIAKIAVAPEHMGRGIATALYQRLLTEHSDWTFITTTVREPIQNKPSFELHRRFGFDQIGSLPMGNRGSFQNVLCDVHLRAAGAKG